MDEGDGEQPAKTRPLSGYGNFRFRYRGNFPLTLVQSPRYSCYVPRGTKYRAEPGSFGILRGQVSFQSLEFSACQNMNAFKSVRTVKNPRSPSARCASKNGPRPALQVSNFRFQQSASIWVCNMLLVVRYPHGLQCLCVACRGSEAEDTWLCMMGSHNSRQVRSLTLSLNIARSLIRHEFVPSLPPGPHALCSMRSPAQSTISL